jgi:transcriptional regulator with XRE-family HTH domain
MEDKNLINEIKKIKEEKGYTLFDLSRILDVQISTLERWLKTNRINRLYAKFVREKLNLK